MRVEIYRDFRFEAAHSLPCVPEAHPCRRVHGHSYRARVSIEAPVNERTGWVMDWGLLDPTIDVIRDKIDHRLLNEILENPTCENLAKWIWDQFVPMFEAAPDWRISVEVQENPAAGAIYRGVMR